MDRSLGNTAIGGENVILIDDKIIGGHVASAAVIINFIPAGNAVIQQRHSHGFIQRGHNTGGGAGLRPQTKGAAGGAADADGHLPLSGGKGGERHGGKGGQNGGPQGFFQAELHRNASFPLCGDGAGLTCRPAPAPARWRQSPSPRTSCSFRSFLSPGHGPARWGR